MIKNRVKYFLCIACLLAVALPCNAESSPVETMPHVSEDSVATVGDGQNQWANKVWYAYGTSMTSELQGTFAKHLAKLSNMKLTNKGIGGGGIIANRNIYHSVMDITDGKTNADMITLEVLANDMSATFGTVMDTDTTTFLGSLAKCIQFLQENTTAQIVVMTSPWARYKYQHPSERYLPQTLFNGHTFQWHCEQMRILCEMYGVYYINPNIAMGYYRKTDAYVEDQIHNTDLGGYALALYMWNMIKMIPIWPNSLNDI